MNWKVCAIIFIILFILETLGLVGLFYLGKKQTDSWNECQINVCDGFDSFTLVDNVCSCYLNNEVAKKEYLR